MSRHAPTASPKLIPICAGIAVLLILFFALGNPRAQKSEEGKPDQAIAESRPEAPTSNSAFADKLPSAKTIQSQENETSDEAKSSSAQPLHIQLRQLTGIQDEAKRKEALASLARSLNESDPAAADALVERVWKRSTRIGNKSRVFLETLTKERYSQDRDKAIAWADALPTEGRIIAYQEIATNWANENPIAATEWAMGIPDPNLSRTMVSSIGTRLEESNAIDSGGAWAENLSQFDVAPDHATLIGSLWGRADVESAFNWASSIEDLSPKKEAFVGIAQAVADLSPEIAKEWIKAIPPEHGIQSEVGTATFYKQPFESIEETAEYIKTPNNE